MPKYRKRPVIVEAVKITRTITIETTNGPITGNRGDYLITEANGEQYPCKADAFEKEFVKIKDSIDVVAILKKSFRK